MTGVIFFLRYISKYFLLLHSFMIIILNKFVWIYPKKINFYLRKFSYLFLHLDSNKSIYLINLTDKVSYELFKEKINELHNVWI